MLPVVGGTSSSGGDDENKSTMMSEHTNQRRHRIPSVAMATPCFQTWRNSLRQYWTGCWCTTKNKSNHACCLIIWCMFNKKLHTKHTLVSCIVQRYNFTLDMSEYCVIYIVYCLIGYYWKYCHISLVIQQFGKTWRIPYHYFGYFSLFYEVNALLFLLNIVQHIHCDMTMNISIMNPNSYCILQLCIIINLYATLRLVWNNGFNFYMNIFKY